MADHTYSISLTWTGNQGTGTSGLRAFTRDSECSSENHPNIPLSTEPGQLGTLTSAKLKPKVTLEDEAQRLDADALHAKAHKMCLIAQAMSIPVEIDPIQP